MGRPPNGGPTPPWPADPTGDSRRPNGGFRPDPTEDHRAAKGYPEKLIQEVNPNAPHYSEPARAGNPRADRRGLAAAGRARRPGRRRDRFRSSTDDSETYAPWEHPTRPGTCSTDRRRGQRRALVNGPAMSIYGAERPETYGGRTPSCDHVDDADADGQAVTEVHRSRLRGVYYRVVSAGASRRPRTVTGSSAASSSSSAGPAGSATRHHGRNPLDHQAADLDQARSDARRRGVSYRRWRLARPGVDVQVFTEKDAISGVILPVTERWDVPLGVCRGYASESFAWSCAQSVCARPARCTSTSSATTTPAASTPGATSPSKVTGSPPSGSAT